MKGNELELWIASLTICNFIMVNRVTIECWSLTNIVQFLQSLLGEHPLLIISGHLGRSWRCPLNRGFTLLRSGFVNEDLTMAVVIAI